MEEDASEGRFYATFEKYQQFTDLQHSILSLDVWQEPTIEENREEDLLLKKMSLILNEYQEQAHLLDPFLEQLVTPVIETIKSHAKHLASTTQDKVPGPRIDRIACLLYSYIKFRGYKTITRFFPHEISDLSIALDYIVSPISPTQDPGQWPLRYSVLLWLSLICMIPFDLEQFDDHDSLGQTSAKLESLARSYLGKAGLDREGSAILLSRLYMRKDMFASLPVFLDWSIAALSNSNDPFPCIGSLQVLCEVVKSGSVEQVKTHLARLLQFFGAVTGNESLTRNTLVRKLTVKLISRAALRLLPATISAARSRVLTSSSVADLDAQTDDSDVQDVDVPEEVETILQELFNALQDKDTVVRWSSAKGVARIAERLPPEYTEQVLDTLIGLFSIHSMAAASIYDMPSLAEGTWHGACLACAEMARRGLVIDERLPELIEWLCKALYFDIRKGAHSIGSNVRDAASYVLWSLARAQGVAALAPHADNLSHRLIAVALFDREIHIRRAASATFQEYVGRTSLFAHGIDILRKTDFYAVGVRRNSFLIAAPDVAEHVEYRPFLIDQLISITLRHWDPSMRQLGAQSLRAICQLDLPNLASDAAHRASQFLTGPDMTDIHGALLALTELAATYQNRSKDSEAERRKIFAYLSQVPLKIVESPRHELVTTAACNLIATSISIEETQLARSSVPHWRKIVDIGLKSKSDVVQEAAAMAMAAKLTSRDRLIREFGTASSPMQQSICKVLGVLDYDAHPHGLSEAVRCLLYSVNRSMTPIKVTVETRRNAYTSMSLILANIATRLTYHLVPGMVCEIIDALQAGLTDYTSDERGDVGSWVRIACVKGLTSLAETLFSHAGNLPNLADYFPASKYHDAVGGILKQGMERLDNVRREAGDCFLRLLLLPLPLTPDAEAWQICGDTLMKQLFLSDNETIGWNDGDRFFPRAVRVLGIEKYREAVLAGLVLSASTKTDSTQRPVSAGLIAYTRTLPVAAEGTAYDLCGLARDLLAQAKRNLGANSVVVPVLQTYNLLLEADVFEPLATNLAGLECLAELLAIASRNVCRLKNHQRIIMSMRM
ncbi:uncharacterized protein FIBRA_05677 [Fibroporia radiculosa]|uniref:Uncharacterized protein n=1 Tax=Fibroporia radiculosa TaxID=599839 RepID=J4G9X5_9APHY|nr:uncharacterized protein FIBRA_05677 [Fibroporia radiculosa]CCM03543.1 predicted protein [Fibroporia radiculosa]